MNIKIVLLPVVLGLACAPLSAFAATPKECPPGLEADAPTVPLSMEQADINSGALSFDEINDHGKALFVAKFNTCDGRGRPETTGGGAKRAVPTFDEEGEPVDAGPDSQAAHLGAGFRRLCRLPQ